jgi:hypothetical protein
LGSERKRFERRRGRDGSYNWREGSIDGRGWMGRSGGKRINGRF